MCFICNGDPVDDDPRAKNRRHWLTGMCCAPCGHPLVCLASCLFMPCMSCYLRRKALEMDYSRYKCCQGFVCSCITEKCCCCTKCCPCLCMTAETCILCPCAVSATRLYVQDHREIKQDPCDNRIIRLNNCLQCLACICAIVACITRIEIVQLLSCITSCVANVVLVTVLACMETQVCVEMDKFPTLASYSGGQDHVVTKQPR